MDGIIRRGRRRGRTPCMSYTQFPEVVTSQLAATVGSKLSIEESRTFFCFPFTQPASSASQPAQHHHHQQQQQKYIPPIIHATGKKYVIIKNIIIDFISSFSYVSPAVAYKLRIIIFYA